MPFCHDYGHEATLERDRLPADVTRQDLTRRLGLGSRDGRV